MKLRTLVGSCAFLGLGSFLAFPTSGQAGSVGSSVAIDVTVTPDGSLFDWDYRVAVTNANQGAPSVGAIEIPEVASGALSALSLPTGWGASEIIGSPIFGAPGLKAGGTPGAYFFLSATSPDNYVGFDSSTDFVDFNLISSVGTAVQADVSTAFPTYFSDYTEYDDITTVDPPTPNVTSSVPEPSTWALMGLGALGLVALRRRKGALAPARLKLAFRR